jgi:hypothetical protein
MGAEIPFVVELDSPNITTGTSLDKALHTVTRWPGQVVQEGKIPTAVWYDTSGKVLVTKLESKFS